MPAGKSQSVGKAGNKNKAAAEKTKITFDIKKKGGILSTSPSGWNKELNIVSWNNGKSKWDIREWSPDHDRMRKGVTLSAEELAVLGELISELDPYETEED